MNRITRHDLGIRPMNRDDIIEVDEECAQVKLGKSEKKYLSGNQEEAIKKVLEKKDYT